MTKFNEETEEILEKAIEFLEKAIEILKEDSKERNEKPIKDSQIDFQKFRENCLKDCVNAYKPFKDE